MASGLAHLDEGLLTYRSELVSYRMFLLSYSGKMLTYSGFYLTYRFLMGFHRKKRVHEWKAVRCWRTAQWAAIAARSLIVGLLSWVKLYLMVLAGYLMISHFYLTFLEMYLTVCDSYLMNAYLLHLSSKEKCMGMESSPLLADCPVGGVCRPILANSGLTRMGLVLSYKFGLVSHNFAFLSYGFRVLTYGFPFSSHERISPTALTRRKVHSNGKQSARGLPSGRQVPPDHSIEWVDSLGCNSIL